MTGRGVCYETIAKGHGVPPRLPVWRRPSACSARRRLEQTALTGDLSTAGTSSRLPRTKGAWAPAGRSARSETLEAKYKLTRNDPTFNIDLSEQNLICDVYQGGCRDNPLHHGHLHARPNWRTRKQPLRANYPLQPGWQQRVVVSTAELSSLPADVASMKTELKTYGPLDIDVSAGDLNSQTLGTTGADHAVLIVGYVDNPVVGRRRLLDHQEQLGGNLERQRLRRRSPTPTRRAWGLSKAITGDGLLHRHHVFQRHRLHESGQLSHRQRGHRHVDRQQQQHLEHQRDAQLDDRRLGLHLGQPGGRGRSSTTPAPAANAPSPSAARPSPTP